MHVNSVFVADEQSYNQQKGKSQRGVLNTLKENKKSFIVTVILTFTLVIMAGCSSKPLNEKTQPSSTAPITDESTNNAAPVAKTLSQQETAEKFVTDHGYKIYLNSGMNADLQLPATFTEKKNDVAVGELLKQRNELSKQKGLDFSGYLSKKVTLYTYGVETKVPNERVVLVMDGNKVVGFGSTTQADFNMLVNALPE
jgi:hypothetical protein